MSERVEWVKGWRNGVKDVFEFFKEMEKVENVEQLQKEYEAWANTDEYTKPNGEVIKRYE